MRKHQNHLPSRWSSTGVLRRSRVYAVAIPCTPAMRCARRFSDATSSMVPNPNGGATQNVSNQLDVKRAVGAATSVNVDTQSDGLVD